MLAREDVTQHPEDIVGPVLKQGRWRQREVRAPPEPDGEGMHYRIYLLDQDDRITRGRDVHCSTDAEAFAEIAHTIGSTSAAELWCGTRCVGRWGPPNRGVAASVWGEDEAAIA
jgi:hypothetical protein